MLPATQILREHPLARDRQIAGFVGPSASFGGNLAIPFERGTN
jgi:hypothetical protein